LVLHESVEIGRDGERGTGTGGKFRRRHPNARSRCDEGVTRANVGSLAVEIERFEIGIGDPTLDFRCARVVGNRKARGRRFDANDRRGTGLEIDAVGLAVRDPRAMRYRHVARCENARFADIVLQDVRTDDVRARLRDDVPARSNCRRVGVRIERDYVGTHVDTRRCRRAGDCGRCDEGDGEGGRCEAEPHVKRPYVLRGGRTNGTGLNGVGIGCPRSGAN